MNEIIELYSFMVDKMDIANKIVSMDEDDFVKDYDIVLVGFSIVESIKELLVKVNRDIFLIYDSLNEISKDFYHFSLMLVNEYGLINRYMLYDYFKNGYKLIFDNISNILKGS